MIIEKHYGQMETETTRSSYQTTWYSAGFIVWVTADTRSTHTTDLVWAAEPADLKHEADKNDSPPADQHVWCRWWCMKHPLKIRRLVIGCVWICPSVKRLCKYELKYMQMKYDDDEMNTFVQISGEVTRLCWEMCCNGFISFPPVVLKAFFFKKWLTQ